MIDTYTENKIRFNIKGENKINEILNYSIPKLINVFKEFEGKQILKNGTSVYYRELFKKVDNKVQIVLKEIKDKFKDVSYLYLDCSEYNIYLKIKLRFDNEGKTEYYDKQKYLININNLKLKDFYDFEEEKPINIDKELKKVNNCFILLEELEKEKEEISLYKNRSLIK